MPQQLLHHFEFCSDTSEQSGVCVPEGMPSESLLNSDALCDRANILAQNCLALDWFPTAVSSACENPVGVSSVPRGFFPFY